MTPFHSINTLKGTIFIGGATSQSIIEKAMSRGARISDFDQSFLAGAAPSPGVASTYTPSVATAQTFLKNTLSGTNLVTKKDIDAPSSIYALLIPAAILYLVTRKR